MPRLPFWISTLLPITVSNKNGCFRLTLLFRNTGSYRIIRETSWILRVNRFLNSDCRSSSLTPHLHNFHEENFKQKAGKKYFFVPFYSAGKSLKKSHFTTLHQFSGNTVWPQASGSQKLTKLKIFGIFNKLLSTQNVNVARFARNFKCDFFYDFQTLCTLG